MRIAVGGLALESVSFLPEESGIEAFEAEALRGAELIEGLRGTASVGGGFLEVLEAAGAEILPLVYSDCSAAGPASDAAFEAYRDEICAGLRAVRDGLDGVLLFLHGAMTTPTRSDPELEMLRAVRETLGAGIPVMVALDLHANLSAETAGLAEGLFGFRYSPHVDMAETGRRAARCLLGRLAGETAPVTRLAKVPLVLPSIFTATELAPLSALVAATIEAGRATPGVLDASLFCGFAYADVPQLGFSVAVVADGDSALAAAMADRLAGQVWEAREALLHRELLHGLEAGVAKARALAGAGRRPVVLLEHADRLNDSTWVLRELLRQGAGRVAVPYLWDPAAAAAALAAGEGARVSLQVGGRSSDRAGGPVAISGRVRYAGHKRYRGTGPMRDGRSIDLGPTAVIEAEGLMLSVTSRSTTAIDLDPFVQFGLEVRDFDVILLRSKTHFRAVYGPLAAEILIVDTPDWGTADLASLPYRRVRPGVFPLSAAG